MPATKNVTKIATKAPVKKVATVKKETKVELAKFYSATGRRKRSTATIHLFEGKGDLIVNDKPIGEYFAGSIKEMEYGSPMKALGLETSFFGTIKVRGGGTTGQLGAVRLAIARAILKFDESHRPVLRKRGLLTRDPREVERKKYNLHKARKAHQYSKR